MIIYYNEPISFELDVIGDTALVEKVEFYIGSQKLRTDTSSPYEATWIDSSEGSILYGQKPIMMVCQRFL